MGIKRSLFDLCILLNLPYKIASCARFHTFLLLSLRSYVKTGGKHWACKALRALQWYPLVSWRCFRNMASDCEGDSDRVFDKHSADTFPPWKGLTERQPSLWAAPLCAYKSRELGGLSINSRFGVRPEKSSSPISVSKSETQSAGRSQPAAALHAQRHLLFDSCRKTSSIRRLATKQTRMPFCIQSICFCLMLNWSGFCSWLCWSHMLRYQVSVLAIAWSTLKPIRFSANLNDTVVCC